MDLFYLQLMSIFALLHKSDIKSTNFKIFGQKIVIRIWPFAISVKSVTR
jgi:hypothetical protein